MIHKHTISLKNAWNGLKWSFKTQPNFIIHFLLSFIAISCGIFFKISYCEFLIIISFIFLGLTIEAINTGIEKTTDAIDRKWREDIKWAKDISAGAMLIFAVGALTISCIIFVPKIYQFFLY